MIETLVARLAAWIFIPFEQVIVATIVDYGLRAVVFSCVIDAFCYATLIVNFFYMIVIGLKYREMRIFVESGGKMIITTELLLRIAFACLAFLPLLAGISLSGVIFVICVIIHHQICTSSTGLRGFALKKYNEIETHEKNIIACFYQRALLFVIVLCFLALNAIFHSLLTYIAQ